MSLNLRSGLTVLLTMLACALAHAQHVPTVVLQDLQTLVKDCNGNFDSARKSLNPVELNGDGISDWVIDTSDIDCDSPTFYCGTGGCTLLIFVSEGGSHRRVWEDNVLGWKSVQVGGRAGIEFELHGSACNRSGHLGCTQRFIFQSGRLVRAN